MGRKKTNEKVKTKNREFQDQIEASHKKMKEIKPKNENQERLIDTIKYNDISFLVGPAGTGKTFLSLATALNLIRNPKTKFKKLIVARPQVATKKLGFLPGSERDKNAPYMRPIIYTLGKILNPAHVTRMVNENRVEQMTLEYMRGMSIDNSIVLLDEAQNVTKPEMLMFLTRIGENTKFIITGDLDQTDLKPDEESGLEISIDRLDGVRGIGMVEFEDTDVVRNKIIKSIVDRFNNDKWHNLSKSLKNDDDYDDYDDEIDELEIPDGPVRSEYLWHLRD